MTFVNVSGETFNTIHVMGPRMFEEIDTVIQNAPFETAVGKSTTVAAGRVRCGRRKSRSPLPFLAAGGQGDFHRGFVSEGSSGLFRRHEPARGCASVRDFPRQGAVAQIN
ncbi:hypothetical protein [Mangrovicoccus ximenensis]|uniref:hypothetical protein n=1 Tax=Mangrovicoccus ximenensis TaxID=1911570 RepID=UPI001F3D5C3C|nr:hypothetical protein [Mangrovicoccus ximenensis]